MRGQKFLLSIRNPKRTSLAKNREDGYVYDAAEILRRGLTVDATRLTFGSRRRKRDPRRENCSCKQSLSKAKEPQEFVKRTAKETSTEIARAAKKHARSPGDASSVPRSPRTE